MGFVVVDGYPDAAIFAQQFPQQLQTRVHHAQPDRVLQIVIVMAEGRTSVLRRIDIDAFDLAGMERNQRFQGFQVVGLNQHVAMVAVAMRQGR